jgi:hypothetical protein
MSGEVRRKHWKNRANDVPVNTFEGSEGRFAPQSFVCAPAEAYVEGRCEIHMHFRAGIVAGGIAGDWRAVVKISSGAPTLQGRW